jgi:ABC-type glycerol-3-phosphate transport system substrate-binding protein
MGCGSSSSDDEHQGYLVTNEQSSENALDDEEHGTEDLVYVPKYVKLPLGERDFIDNFVVSGDYVYYNNTSRDASGAKTTLYRMLLTDPLSPEALPVVFTGDIYISALCIDRNGDYLIISQHGGATQASVSRYLQKYHPDGTAVFSQDITQVIASDPTNSSVERIETDGEGRIYILGNSTIWMFDQNGQFHGDLYGGEFLDSLMADSDGKVYASRYIKDEKMLLPIDFEGKVWGEAAYPFPHNDDGQQIVLDGNRDLLLMDFGGLISYDLVNATSTRVLNWLDCDIVSTSIRFYTLMADGRIAVITNTDRYSTDGAWEYVFLTKTPASQVPQKDIIEIGTIFEISNSKLSEIIVNFNKYSDSYRITVKSYAIYTDFSAASQDREDSIASMAADLLTGEGPDIISFSDGFVDYEIFAARGFLEDLTPYSQKSDILHLDNLMDAVVRACSYDGKLVCLPTQFNVQTIVGKTALVGNKTGWTMEELGDLVDAHPDEEIFMSATKSSMLELCMTYLGESFLKWEEESCDFDSDEFKQMLALCNRFPQQAYVDTQHTVDIQDSLVNDSVLLQAAVIRTLPFYMMARGQFLEPATCIGYPTADGSPGNIMTFWGDTFGISSQSEHKEGAWAFLEYALTYKWRGNQGFPILKSVFEANAAASLLPDGALDVNGNEAYWPKSALYDTINRIYSLDCPQPTQADIDSLRALIDSATYRSRTNSVIMSIIAQEAAPYFAGHKTVDEVAEIIQSRASIYVSENSQ